MVLVNANNKYDFFKLYERVKKREIDLDSLDPKTIHKLLLIAEEEHKLRKIYSDKQINKLIYDLQEMKKRLENLKP